MGLQSHYQSIAEQERIALEQKLEAFDLNEVGIAEEAMDSAQTTADEAWSIEASLEEVANLLEQSLEDGGIDSKCAKGLEIAAGANAARMGVSVESIISFEGFEDDELSNRRATEIALESVVDTIKKIWDAIVKAINNAIKTVVDFVKKALTGVSKIRKSLEKLRDKAKKGEGAQEGTIKISNPQALWFDGAVTPSYIARGLENAVDVGNVLMGPYLDRVDDLYKDMSSQILSNPQFLKSLNREEMKKALGLKPGEELVFAMAGGQPYAKLAEQVQLIEGRSYIGGWSFKLERKNHTFDSWKSKRDEGVERLSSSIELDRPDSTKVLEIIDRALELVDVLDREREVKKTLVDKRKDIVKQGNDLVKQYTDDKILTFLNQSEFSSLMRNFAIDPGKPILTFIRHAFSALTGVQKFSEKSLAA